MSLTTCLKKAGSAIHSADKESIITRSRELRTQGVSVSDAAMRAVDEQIAAVEKMLSSALRTDGNAKHGEPAKANEKETDVVGVAEKPDAPAAGVNGKKPGELDDAGERLEGARKFKVWAKTEVSDDDIATLPLSKIWPADAVTSIEDHEIAAVAHVLREQIPAKPRVAYRVKGWIEKVKEVRGLAQQVVGGQMTPTEFIAEMRSFRGGADSALRPLADKSELLIAIDREQWGRIGDFSVRPNSTVFEDGKPVGFGAAQVEVDGRTHYMRGVKTVEEALEKVRELLGVEAPTKSAASLFEIRRRSSGGIFINRKGDKEYRPLKTFADIQQARAFLRSNADELVAAWEAVKERDNVRKSDVRSEENRERAGVNHRKGRDVTAEEFRETFGFRGVQFGNWVAQGANAQGRQGMLNEAFDALMDLASLVGVPPRAISLNGSLGLAFGARGGGWASAHFEPSNLVINLTKTRGAGKLAHEWFHALDNYFALQRGGEKPFAGDNKAYRQQNYVTYKAEPGWVNKSRPSAPVTSSWLEAQRRINPNARWLDPENWIRDPKHPEGIRPEVEGRFAALVDTLNESPMNGRAQANDKEPDGYWSRIIERAARAFENYVIHEMQARGFVNDYLANVRPVESFTRNPERYPYLLPSEVAPVADAFRTLFSEIKTRTDEDGNVAMFSRGPSELSPERAALDALSKNDDLFALPKSEKGTVEGIAADNDPKINVKPSSLPNGDTMYTLTMPSGKDAYLTVRKPRKDGKNVYSFELIGDAAKATATVRPGENHESVDPATEDLWIDVSRLESGDGGAEVYSIAATYANNTGRIFIGDPYGFSKDAMRRRTEQMLSSALKFGTTKHIAPHPKQIDGDAKLGIPPLQWVYGDDIGNIRRMIDVNLKALDNAFPGASSVVFDLTTGEYVNAETGRPIDRLALRKRIRQVRSVPNSSASVARAGRRTIERASVWRALLREEGREGSGSGRRDGLLARLAGLMRDHGTALEKLFYSRSVPNAGSVQRSEQHRASVDALAKAISSRWENAPDVVVVGSFGDKAVPAAVRNNDQEQRSQGATGDPKGFFYAGKVYLVADQLGGASDVMRVLFHEALGHHGLRGLFGKELDAILDRLAILNAGKVRKKAKEYGLDFDKPNERRQAAEEVLAEMAEVSPNISWVRKAIAAIRDWLRANVPGFSKMRLSDSEIIRDFILPASEFVRGGRRQSGGLASPAMAFNRADGAAFKAWFGDSKVVDADGKPLVVYHGTVADFDSFDNSKTGANDRGLWGRGHYFAASPESANSYAMRQGDGARMMPVYVSIKNPLILKTGGDLITRLPDGTNAKDLIGENLDGAKIKQIAEAGGHDGVIQLKPNGLIGDVAAYSPEQIKSATGNRGTYDAESADIRFSRSVSAQPFYSALARQIEQSPMNAGAPSAWSQYLDALAKRGAIKADEVEWSGLREWLGMQPSKVTKAQIAEYLDANGVQVTEKVLGSKAQIVDAAKLAIRQSDDLGYDSTDAMRQQAADGLPMFSRSKPEQATGGKPVTTMGRGWRDETGRWQVAPGQVLYDLLGKAASPLLVKMGMKAMSPELKKQVRAMKLQVAKAQEVAITVAKEMFQMSETERKLVSDLIEREVETGTVPPVHAVRMAAGINQVMNQQTDELVRLEMLSKESADMWRGQYLPRFYESKLRQSIDPWLAALRKITSKQGPMQGIKGKNLKGRGLWETIPADELADWEALGWTLRDKDFNKATSTEAVVWRDYTREERDKMGEIRDAGFRFVMGYMSMQKDIALGQMFEGIASDKALASKVEKEGFVQVPETTVRGTMGVKVYGKLAGMWVPKEVLSHLSRHGEANNEILTMYRKVLGAWKEGKTVLNPVAHGNNVLSNLTMAHFAGVSYWDGHKYIGALRDIITGDKMVKEAKDAGLFLGTMSQEEMIAQIGKSMPKEFRDMLTQETSVLQRNAKRAFDVVSLFLRKPMGAAYEAEDLFFRYLIYRDARQRGLEPNDAVDYSQKFIFTYDDLPGGARKVRDFAIPFFSYSYKAAPVLLHTALTHPHRFVAPMAAMWGINALSYALMAGEDDEDWEKKLREYATSEDRRKAAHEMEKGERENLPPWMKGSTALGTPKAIRLGEDDLTGLPLFIDVSRIVPGGDIFDAHPNSGGMPWPQPLTPNHPLLTTFAGLFANKDSFKGKDIVDMNDTSGEATQKRAGWMWRQFAPAIAVGNGHWDRGMNVLANVIGEPVKWWPDDYTGIGKDGQPVQAKHAAMQTVGLKVRPLDLDAGAEIEGNQKERLIKSIDAEVRALNRLNARGALSDEQVDREIDKAREKQQRLRDGLTVDGSKKE